MARLVHGNGILMGIPWESPRARGDGTGYQQTSISKSVIPNHANCNI